MATVQNVRDCVKGAHSMIKLFGATEGFQLAFHTRVRDLGEAILEENHGVQGKDRQKVDFVLGPKSKKLFNELEIWLVEQEESFKETRTLDPV